MSEVILIAIILIVIIILLYIKSTEYLVEFLYDKKILRSKDLKDEQERLINKLDIVIARNKQLKSSYIIKKEKKLKQIEYQKIIQQRDNDITRQREEIEEKKRKKEERLNNCIENYRDKKLNRSSEKIGARYERQIGYIYEQRGMNVSYNGIYKKLQDDGIDLIIKDKKTHLLIQCKNYAQKHQIHSNTIAQLVGDSATYALENPNIKVHAMLVTSYDNLDDRAREYLKLHNIEHFIKQYSVEYPLIKCKKESMIYHLPCNANYDRIKINIKKGDRYLESEQEAVDDGFRLANN